MDTNAKNPEIIDRIIESIKITLYQPFWGGFPVHKDKLFQFLILDPKIERVSKEQFDDAVRLGPFTQGQLGFIGISSGDFESKVEEINKLNAISRDKFREVEKKLLGLRKYSFIKYIGVTGNVSYGLADSDDLVDVIVLSPEGTQNVATSLAKLLGARLRSKINLEVGDEIELPSNNVEAAYQLLTMATIVNSGKVYESMVGASPWVFEIFRNYPLDKVSFNFRVTNQMENYKPGFFTSMLDRVL